MRRGVGVPPLFSFAQAWPCLAGSWPCMMVPGNVCRFLATSAGSWPCLQVPGHVCAFLAMSVCSWPANVLSPHAAFVTRWGTVHGAYGALCRPECYLSCAWLMWAEGWRGPRWLLNLPSLWPVLTFSPVWSTQARLLHRNDCVRPSFPGSFIYGVPNFYVRSDKACFNQSSFIWHGTRKDIISVFGTPWLSCPCFCGWKERVDFSYFTRSCPSFDLKYELLSCWMECSRNSLWVKMLCLTRLGFSFYFLSAVEPMWCCLLGRNKGADERCVLLAPATTKSDNRPFHLPGKTEPYCPPLLVKKQHQAAVQVHVVQRSGVWCCFPIVVGALLWHLVL